MNLETTRAALALIDEGTPFAWVTLLSTHGSAPRHSGAGMLVRRDGSIAGTIGGGPLEAAAIKDSLRVIETGGSYLSPFDSPQLGMMCGGGGLVLIEAVDPGRPEAVRFFRDFLAVLESGHKGWLVTLVPEGGSAADAVKCLVGADGSVSGDPFCDPEILRSLVGRGWIHGHVIPVGLGTAYVQAIGARGTAYVFGAGHCGEKLAPVLGFVGFSVVVIDDRAEFANPERFPTADRIVVPDSFTGVVGSLPIDEHSYVVIVTRGHSHDKNVLAQALRTPAGYIGMIGSKNKVAGVFEALLQQGFTPEDLARVHAPIGLPIGGETPEEIAISIAAELIQARAASGS